MKSSKHNTKASKAPKSLERKELDMELSLGFFRDYPISKERLINLGKDLLLMLKENPKMVTMGPWIEKHDLCYQTMDNWREKHPEFDRIYQQAKRRMGNRILEKSLYKEFDSNMARFCLSIYDTDVKKLEEWRTSMKKDIAKAEEANRIVTINVPTFLPSGKVPDKEETT